MQLVILAGGKGTRMGDLARTIPKPMVRLAGKPILEHQVELARRYGACHILLLTGHLGEVIEDYFGDGSRWGVQIEYHQETVPLGTAGALKEVEDHLEADFLVFYGDTILDVDLGKLVALHRQRQPLATLAVHPNDHPWDSDLVELGDDQRIVAVHCKPHPAGESPGNCANAALYVISRRLLEHVHQGQSADLARDVFPQVVAAGYFLAGYNTPEYIKDVGTPERLAEIERDLVSGKVARLNRANARGAIFLDRDGVLNLDRDPVVRAEDLELLPGAAEAIRRINHSEILAVVVTNQPAIAKGWLAPDELRRIHLRLATLLGAERAYVDRIDYCPHHPERGFEGEIAQYKITCECRKPGTGMILAAQRDLNLDLHRSWIIGDSTADIAAGLRAGCRTILVRTGCGGRDGKYDVLPEFVCEDILEAVSLALDAGPGPAVRAGASFGEASDPDQSTRQGPR